jgi:VanZ family protein
LGVSPVKRLREPVDVMCSSNMRTVRENQLVRWVAVVTWMGLIFYLSAQPRLPRVIPLGLPQIQDIIGHFTVYGVLAVLLWWALRGAGVRHPLFWALASAILYGASDEFHQSFVPNRHPDVFDLATDLAGAATALLIVRWLCVRGGRTPDQTAGG